MILPVMEQGRLFLMTIAGGFLLAFIYDIFRVFRNLIPHNKIAVHIEDLFYWIFIVLIMFYFILMANSGEIRLFAICGAFIGMLVYFNTVSGIFLKFSLAIFGFIKQMALLILATILAPFKLLAYFLSFPARLLKERLSIVYNKEKLLYNRLKLRSRQRARKFRNDFKIMLRKI